MSTSDQGLSTFTAGASPIGFTQPMIPCRIIKVIPSPQGVESPPKWERRPIPAVSWYRIWLTSLLFAVGITATLEFFWRSHGWLPNVVDSPALWAWHRSRVSGPESYRTIVCVGSSRIHTGLSKEVLQQRLPGWRIVQLAVSARPPKATLEDLANDEGFRGVVLLSITPQVLEKYWWSGQEDYVRCFHESAFNTRLNAWWTAMVQDLLVFGQPSLGWSACLKQALRERRLPERIALTGCRDRFLKIDFRCTATANVPARVVEARRATYDSHVVSSPEHWLESASEFETLADRIAARGGAVIFIRFPVSGESLTLDETHYPKEKYWDLFAVHTKHVALHYRDVAGLSRFDCPDTIHLDCRDTPAFTGALLDTLDRHGALAARDIKTRHMRNGWTGDRVLGQGGIH